jgi:hypothetical protein
MAIPVPLITSSPAGSCPWNEDGGYRSPAIED